MNDLASIKVELKANGTGLVEVNGEDISDRIRGLALQVVPGQTPVMTVHQLASASRFEGQGIVQVQSDPQVVADSILRFLEAMDPEELERVSLERQSWGDSAIESMLAVMKEWAGARN